MTSELFFATPGTVRQTAEVENISWSLFLFSRYWTFFHPPFTEVLGFHDPWIDKTALPA